MTTHWLCLVTLNPCNSATLTAVSRPCWFGVHYEHTLDRRPPRQLPTGCCLIRRVLGAAVIAVSAAAAAAASVSSRSETEPFQIQRTTFLATKLIFRLSKNGLERLNGVLLLVNYSWDQLLVMASCIKSLHIINTLVHPGTLKCPLNRCGFLLVSLPPWHWHHRHRLTGEILHPHVEDARLIDIVQTVVEIR